jgi:hypothetical protein
MKPRQSFDGPKLLSQEGHCHIDCAMARTIS